MDVQLRLEFLFLEAEPEHVGTDLLGGKKWIISEPLQPAEVSLSPNELAPVEMNQDTVITAPSIVRLIQAAQLPSWDSKLVELRQMVL